MSAYVKCDEIHDELDIASLFEQHIRKSLENLNLRPPHARAVPSYLAHVICNLVNFFDILNECSRRYTEEVVAGEIEYDEKIDEKLKEHWRSWRSLATIAMLTAQRYGKTPAPSRHFRKFSRQFVAVQQYEKLGFDHHSHSIIDSQKIDFNALRDSKFPVEFWDSPE